MRPVALYAAAGAALLAAAPAHPAPGQSHADYLAWLAREPGQRMRVKSLRDHLQARGVADVVPTWQIVRTASMWRGCMGPRFEVPPAAYWDNIVPTLRFIARNVEPALGPVRAVSAYRNESLNSCAGGAPGSAHRSFQGLDLVPARALPRMSLLSRLCPIHRSAGEAAGIGLGIYQGVRFHIDANGFRRWGVSEPLDLALCGPWQRRADGAGVEGDATAGEAGD
ncbi:MAG: hypothetical protein ACFBQW_00360 [Sphingomonadaceae bacterium]